MWKRKIGPLEVNFRVPLEPKGLLRIIIFVLSILAFALTAGYSSSDNTEQCIVALDADTNVTVTIALEFGYTFHSENFDVMYPSVGNTRNSSGNGSSVGPSVVGATCQKDFDKNFDGGAEFFVAMGVLSMLYSLGSIPVYMLFLNDQWSYAKLIANIDFVASIIFSFVYLIADIVWSAQTAALKSYVDDELESRSVCLNVICVSESIRNTGSFLQLNISLVFGWLATVTWIATLWFLFKDTTFFNDPRAPWAKKKTEADPASDVKQNPIAENQNAPQTKSDEHADP